MLCCDLEKNGMVRAWHGHGMASVNRTWPHCVNQMGKTHSKLLAARHGRGTAWARHGNGMLCVNRPLVTRHHRNFLQWEALGYSLSSLFVNPFLYRLTTYFNTRKFCSLHIKRIYVFRMIKKLDVISLTARHVGLRKGGVFSIKQ